jgi:septal ring factor EnvC (AmiA/AmiB activator)
MKKLLAFLLALTIVAALFAAPIVSADNKASDFKKKISNLQDQEKNYSDELREAKKNIADKEQYSDTLVSQIGVLNEEISAYRSEIDKLNKSISQKNKSIKKSQKRIKAQVDALKNRIRAIYRAGNASSLEIILGAKDFSDFLDKRELLKKLSDYDEKLITGLQKELDSITGEKEALEKEKSEVETAHKQLTKKQDKLSDLLDENKQVLSELYAEKDDAQSRLEKANAQENELQRQLSAYYKKLEAQKAAQRAIQQQNNAPEKTDSNDSSGNNSSSDAPEHINVEASGFTWPVPGFYYVISPFNEDRGYSHKGIDITGGGIMGATVVAAGGGTVIASYNGCTHNWGKSGSCGCGGGYGNYVMIDHGNGKTTTYGHLSSAAVSTGASVSKGQTIGYVGSTGWSTGAHLHYETRLNGVAYDPMSEH